MTRRLTRSPLPARALRRWAALGAVVLAVLLGTGTPASAASYVPISGAGSTWSANALDAWRKNVNQYGMTVNYAPVGAATGRHEMNNGQVGFAASDIPVGR
jgi:phosphate transport system substrate-binding protein